MSRIPARRAIATPHLLAEFRSRMWRSGSGWTCGIVYEPRSRSTPVCRGSALEGDTTLWELLGQRRDVLVFCFYFSDTPVYPRAPAIRLPRARDLTGARDCICSSVIIKLQYGGRGCTRCLSQDSLQVGEHASVGTPGCAQNMLMVKLLPDTKKKDLFGGEGVSVYLCP